jgi:hypothetical protein
VHDNEQDSLNSGSSVSGDAASAESKFSITEYLDRNPIRKEEAKSLVEDSFHTDTSMSQDGDQVKSTRKAIRRNLINRNKILIEQLDIPKSDMRDH